MCICMQCVAHNLDIINRLQHIPRYKLGSEYATEQFHYVVCVFVYCVCLFIVCVCVCVWLL